MIKRWIINIIDRSASMSPLKETVISSYNNFLQDIKSDVNDIRWTSILFNDNVDILHDDSIKNIEKLQDKNYIPCKETATLDAIGRGCMTIINNSVEYNDIVINIFTDGEENCSTSYTYSSINDLLTCIKSKYNVTTNFYCTSTESLELPYKIPSIDTKYINENFNDCMRQMSSNSQSKNSEYSGAISCPQIKRQKLL